MSAPRSEGGGRGGGSAPCLLEAAVLRLSPVGCSGEPEGDLLR